MSNATRRVFLQSALAGGMGAFWLPANAQPTLTNIGPSGVPISISALPIPEAKLPVPVSATEENILGPYYRELAPYRAKVTPPLEPGQSLLIRGRVWDFAAKKPLSGVVLDVWQANSKGSYDNDNPKLPPASGLFHNRARMITDELGYYEFETIHPGAYQIGPEAWRPPHIHFMVRQAGFKKLVTQMYFLGDKLNKSDQFFLPSLAVAIKELKVGKEKVELGWFDIVLQKE